MKQITGHSLQRSRLWQAIPWVWVAAGFLFDLWYQFFPGRNLLDADLASEVLLADLLNQEKSIVSTNWFYSTELRVFNLQWFYRVGLWLFSQNWQLVRAVGMTMALALYGAVLLLFARSAGFRRGALWLAGALLWPFGQRYLLYGIFGGYYLVHPLFYLSVLALLFHSAKPDTVHRGRLWAVACVISLLFGMNGVKQLMVFYAPLLLTVLAVAGLALHDCGKSDWKAACRCCRPQLHLLCGTILTSMACTVGYGINSVVLARWYTFKTFGGIAWSRSEEWFSLDGVIADFFHEFGYQNGGNLLGFSGMATGLGLALGGVVFLCLVRLLWRLRTLRLPEQTLALLLFFMILICAVCYTYFQEYNQYYWLTALPIAISVVAVELKTENFHLPGARSAAAALLAAVITVCAIHTVRREIEKPLLAHKNIEVVTDWLEEQGYTGGYATFWNANAVTGLSSGRVEMWTLVNLSDDVIMDWLQKKDHVTTDPERPFLLFDTETDGDPDKAKLITGGNCDKIYDDGRYQVYLFDSAADVHAAARLARGEE